MTRLAYSKEHAFNALCPYYTMFPLEYPLRLLKRHKNEKPIVLDPFCGRGTTLYAARKLGLVGYGLDISPIAASIAQAKLAKAPVDDVISLAEEYLSKRPKKVPSSPFFKRAYAPKTLTQICSLREGLLSETRRSNASTILRAAVLGCLHGPLNKGTPSYFSNQMPRTFASKHEYSIRFWNARGLTAPEVDVAHVLRRKLARIPDLNSPTENSHWHVRNGDARHLCSYKSMEKASVIITSPPYYGMKTYVQDQWLRSWFLGGPETPDYRNGRQLSHTGQGVFIEDLAKVWKRVREHSRFGAHLYIRFGAIPSVASDPKSILTKSLERTKRWGLISVRTANSAHEGKRQADHMGSTSDAQQEYDFHAIAI